MLNLRCLVMGHDPYSVFSFVLSPPSSGYDIAYCRRCFQVYHLSHPVPQSEEDTAKWIKEKYPNVIHYRWGDFRRDPEERQPSIKLIVSKQGEQQYGWHALDMAGNLVCVGAGTFPGPFSAHYTFRNMLGQALDPHQRNYEVEYVDTRPDDLDKKIPFKVRNRPVAPLPPPNIDNDEPIDKWGYIK